MNPFEIKVFLLKEGITIADIARKIAGDDDTKFKSYQAMLSDMFLGKRFHPSLAEKVNELYPDLDLQRPAQQENAKSIVKHAA